MGSIAATAEAATAQAQLEAGEDNCCCARGVAPSTTFERATHSVFFLFFETDPITCAATTTAGHAYHQWKELLLVSAEALLQSQREGLRGRRFFQAEAKVCPTVHSLSRRAERSDECIQTDGSL